MKISIYDIEDEPIGIGGMGKVYLGRDGYGNPVAIKEMLSQFVPDSNLRARFHQEIKILNQMEHPSIVKMYASFEEKSNLYMVMEYIKGETLAKYIETHGMFRETDAVGILRKILGALEYAHQKGFVHRDIKPSNIMIKPDGKICLLDFGIAKDMNGNGLTVGQLTIGTDGYMSPEQAEGYNIDQRSDIYSLGCVLFYMLTGRHAIQKQSNDHATRMAIINNDIPQLINYNPNLSDNIQRILNKATNKNMLQRYQSCKEFEIDLNGGKTTIPGNGGKNIITIGRENCDIIVYDPNQKVSRHHVDVEKIHFHSECVEYIIRDRSANGTIVNGKMIHNNEFHYRQFYRESGYGPQIAPMIFLSGKIEVKWKDIEEAFEKKQEKTKPLVTTTPPTPKPSAATPTPTEDKSATGWLIAIYIFAVAGGLLGLILGISISQQKISFQDGNKIYKYKQSHRIAALIGAILSAISMIIWKTIIIGK